MTRLDEQRELSSLGGQKARAIDRGAPESEIRAIQVKIDVARAERTIRKVLASVPAEARPVLAELIRSAA